MKNFYVIDDSPITRQPGYSLLEVLIAIVITSVGLLGLAAMQAIGLQNNLSSYHSSQATVLAYDIADRIRANKISVGNYLTDYMTLAQATEAGLSAGCKNAGGCSADQLAKNDLIEWKTSLEAALPGAEGEITGPVDDIYTITIKWNDNWNEEDDDGPILRVSFQP